MKKETHGASVYDSTVRTMPKNQLITRARPKRTSKDVRDETLNLYKRRKCYEIINKRGVKEATAGGDKREEKVRLTPRKVKP